MSYTGMVSGTRRPDTRSLSTLDITKLSVGPMDNNAYLLRCKETGDGLLIDAANDEGRLLDLIGDAGLSTVVTTHRHADHWQALEDVVASTGARSLAGEADATSLPIPSSPLNDQDTVRVGTCSLTVIHLVGHTPGSIALLYTDPEPGGIPHLFTGDSLFPGGVGNTFGSKENFESLINDVEHKLFDRLPDETWFYPGHGNDSTLGTERPSIPEWRTRGW